jgi:hypothetical protein
VKSSVAKPDKPLLIVVAIIVVLVCLALIVVFTRGGEPLQDASTPEGVVQRYSSAVIAGDEQQALQYATDAAASECEIGGQAQTENIRITLVSTTERSDSADVRVLIISSYSSGPFGTSEFETEDVFDLVLLDGKWLVDRAPWQLMVCANRGDSQ